MMDLWVAPHPGNEWCVRTGMGSERLSDNDQGDDGTSEKEP
jgi:hypothetical protein